MAIINSSGGFDLSKFTENIKSVTPSANQVMEEVGRKTLYTGLNTLSTVKVPLTDTIDKMLDKLPVTYRVGNINAGWDLANMLTGLYGVISGAVTPVSPNMNILYNSIDGLLNLALDAIGMGDLNKARTILYENQSGGGVINELIKTSTKEGVKYTIKDEKLKDWMKKDNKLPIEDRSALQTKSLGIFDESKWFVTMEVPESSRMYGIPDPPYNRCSYIDQNVLKEENQNKIIERRNADLSDLERRRVEELNELNRQATVDALSPEFFNSDQDTIGNNLENLNITVDKEKENELNKRYDNLKTDIENNYKTELSGLSYYSNTEVNYSATGFIPTVGSINYEYMNGSYENITAVQGLGINIPTAKFDKYTLTFSIINDQHNTVFNYIKQYANAMFPGYRTVLPYKHCVSIIRIFVLNRQKHVINRYSLLGIPNIDSIRVNGSARSAGSNGEYQLIFDIVGELNKGEKFSF